MLEISLTLLITLALAWPLSKYMALIFSNAPSKLDRAFRPFETLFYRAIGVNPTHGMTWRGYARALIGTNIVFGVFLFAMLMLQGNLPLNPDKIAGMPWDLALHTAISFLTNTNQQHYSGQAQLSYLSQSAGIVTLQILTPAMGLAIALAILRGLFGARNAHAGDTAQNQEGQPRNLGNFYVDVTRATLRLLLPLSFLLALILTSQGVPSTFAGANTATPLDTSAGMASQTIPVGPMAAMVAIKQLGTNGGGWYGPNSTVPLENPTPISNVAETVALVLLPMAIVLMIAPLTGRKRLSALVFGVMAAFSLSFIALSAISERAPNAAALGLSAPGANMEGKEQRFGTDASALWSNLTTQTSNGSVNAMHDSLNPLAGGVAITSMLVNAIWGGVGCGLVGFLVYLLIGVFLSGLMIGRTPEIYGRKIEFKEIKWLSLLVILQPILILVASAVALQNGAITGNSNPCFHGISQVFYEYVSAYANNGSGFEGLSDATKWWNLSTSVLLLVGRYASLLIPLAVVGSLAVKRIAPVTPGTQNIETPTFAITLIAVIFLLTLLCFLPALALGPVAEALQLAG